MFVLFDCDTPFLYLSIVSVILRDELTITCLVYLRTFLGWFAFNPGTGSRHRHRATDRKSVV